MFHEQGGKPNKDVDSNKKKKKQTEEEIDEDEENKDWWTRYFASYEAMIKVSPFTLILFK